MARQARGSQCILGESSSTGTGMRTVSSDGMGGDAKLVDADTAVSRALPLLTKLVVFVAAKQANVWRQDSTEFCQPPLHGPSFDRFKNIDSIYTVKYHS